MRKTLTLGEHGDGILNSITQTTEKWDSLVLSRADFWMIWKCHGISRFHFYLLFINNGIRDQLDEEDFRRCYGNSFWKCQSESTWSQLCSKFFINYEFFLNSQLRGTQTTAIERHLTIENFTDIDQHRSWACTKAFNLFLYEYDYSLCLTQAYILNLTKYWYSVYLEVHAVPLHIL